MSALERRAGMPLLDRTTRGVRLTDAGEALLASCRCDPRRADPRRARTGGDRGWAARCGWRRFRPPAPRVPAAVSAFIARYPDVELSVLEAEPEESVPMLRAGELEVAIVATTLNQPKEFGELYEGIDLHHLLDEPRCALLPTHHRLARRRRLRVEDLAGEVWIELGRSATRHGRVFLASGAGSDAEPRVGFHSDDFNVVPGNSRRRRRGRRRSPSSRSATCATTSRSGPLGAPPDAHDRGRDTGGRASLAGDRRAARAAGRGQREPPRADEAGRRARARLTGHPPACSVTWPRARVRGCGAKARACARSGARWLPRRTREGRPWRTHGWSRAGARRRR